VEEFEPRVGRVRNLPRHVDGRPRVRSGADSDEETDAVRARRAVGPFERRIGRSRRRRGRLRHGRFDDGFADVWGLLASGVDARTVG